MKSVWANLRDTLVAGLLFLLPLLILLVIITKVFNLLAGITGKIAAMFGMKSVMGVSGGTIVSGLSLVLICFACGYLMRLSLFKFLNKYLDKKLAQNLPGYQAYRDMARSKLESKEEELPYKSAAWIKLDEKVFEPAFIMEEVSNNTYVVFIPIAGNAKEGKVAVLPAERVQSLAGVDMKSFQKMINSQGKGIGALQIPS